MPIPIFFLYISLNCLKYINLFYPKYNKINIRSIEKVDHIVLKIIIIEEAILF